MHVSLREADLSDRALIANIFNMYQNELSVYNDSFTHLDAQGYFDITSADEVLPFGNGVYPYIITLNGLNVGLLLVSGAPYALEGCDYCVQELFVIARLRGKGVAREAVAQAFSGRPGRWCLSVFSENARARAFWDGVMRAMGLSARVCPGERGMLNYVFTVGEVK